MLSLAVHLLGGRYAATTYNDRRTAEWPPHPARIYSALVAALHESELPDEAEREALDWFATLGAPEIFASPAGRRSVIDVFVPTNDVSSLADLDGPITQLEEAEAAAAEAIGKEREKADKAVAKAKASLVKRSAATGAADGKGTPSNAAQVWPTGRPKQPRTFPVVFPDDPVVHLTWAVDPPADTLVALDRVASRVARLGHSSSMVSLRFDTAEIAGRERARWTPEPDGELILRVPQRGQRQRLEEAHARHQQVAPRLLPSAFAAYAEVRERAEAQPPRSVFAGDGIVFEVVPGPEEGARRLLLDVSLAQQVARAMRGTLLSAVGETWPEALGGHAPGGGPASRPHLAFVPLADVGHEFATGSILGVALVPPRDLSEADRRELSRGIRLAEAAAGESRLLRLTLGRSGVLHLRRLVDPSPKTTLQIPSWARVSRRWATVTPIALGRNPGNLGSRDDTVVERALRAAEQTIAENCVHIGLPAPEAVYVHRRSLIESAPAARRFMPYPSQGSGPQRVCVHAEIVFEEPVGGPVLLGAGRHFGIGLCRPREER